MRKQRISILFYLPKSFYPRKNRQNQIIRYWDCSAFGILLILMAEKLKHYELIIMERTAIFFGSSGGVTESVASKMADKIGNGVEVFNVANTPAGEAEKYQNLIFGTSTWGIGDLQDDWDIFLPELAKINLSGKTIALFGLGDCESYPDSFVDGIGTIYEGIKDKGCTIVGEVETDGYSFDDSKAVYEGKFIGLPLDEDNESNQTESRIDNWLKQILPQFR
jgi:flavodoxin I